MSLYFIALCYLEEEYILFWVRTRKAEYEYMNMILVGFAMDMPACHSKGNSHVLILRPPPHHCHYHFCFLFSLLGKCICFFFNLHTCLAFKFYFIFSLIEMLHQTYIYDMAHFIDLKITLFIIGKNWCKMIFLSTKLKKNWTNEFKILKNDNWKGYLNFNIKKIITNNSQLKNKFKCYPFLFKFQLWVYSDYFSQTLIYVR